MKIKMAILILLGLMSFSVFLSQRAAAYDFFCSRDNNGVCQSGVCKDQPGAPTCQQDTKQLSSGTNPALDKIHVATNLIALVAAIGAVILIIYAGFQFATAGGSTESATKTKEARSTIVGAVVGLVIIALAWTIITFVSNRLIKS